MVKHASELRDVLEEGLAETPTAPWRGMCLTLFYLKSNYKFIAKGDSNKKNNLVFIKLNKGSWQKYIF